MGRWRSARWLVVAAFIGAACAGMREANGAGDDSVQAPRSSVMEGYALVPQQLLGGPETAARARWPERTRAEVPEPILRRAELWLVSGEDHGVAPHADPRCFRFFGELATDVLVPARLYCGYARPYMGKTGLRMMVRIRLVDGEPRLSFPGNLSDEVRICPSLRWWDELGRTVVEESPCDQQSDGRLMCPSGCSSGCPPQQPSASSSESSPRCTSTSGAL